MRKLLILGVVLAAVVALSASATSEPGPVSVSYSLLDPGAPIGVLTLENARGRHFVAHDVNFMPVLDGVVKSDHFEALCPNAGVNSQGIVLYVNVEPDLFFAVDPDGYHWDR